MAIKRFSIENFRGFKSHAAFDLGRITLLLGANSSGKSSVMNALLCCLQSEGFLFFLNLNSEWVSLGNFEGVVNRHNKNEEFVMQIDFDDSRIDTVKVWWVLDKKTKQPTMKRCEAKGRFDELTITLTDQLYHVDGMVVVHVTSDREIVSEAELTILKREISKKSSSLESEEKNLLNEPLGNYTTPIRVPIENIQVKSIESLSIIDASLPLGLKIALRIINATIQKHQADVSFIGPFRDSPNRSYAETSKPNYKVLKDGSGYTDQILNWETTEDKALDELASAMKKLELFDAVKTKRSSNGMYELLVKPHKWSSYENIIDVGFGIGQFLPIAVADTQLEGNGTFFLAEPEIHLHPSVQSKLGDYLLSSLSNSNKRYVIETHSEYLLNRIRLHIVDGNLSEDDVKVYFMEPSKGDTKVHRLVFNQKGQIENAPESYFKTYTDDVMDIMINASA